MADSAPEGGAFSAANNLAEASHARLRTRIWFMTLVSVQPQLPKRERMGTSAAPVKSSFQQPLFSGGGQQIKFRENRFTDAVRIELFYESIDVTRLGVSPLSSLVFE